MDLIPIATRTYLSPRAEFINYAFLLQDLYFLRQELECMLNFLLSTRAAPPTASPLQLLPRQLIEKCAVARRILIHSYLCTHITPAHTGNGFVYFLVCIGVRFLSVCLHLVSWTIPKHSQQCRAAPYSILLSLAVFFSFPPYYCQSEVKDYI